MEPIWNFCGFINWYKSPNQIAKVAAGPFSNLSNSGQGGLQIDRLPHCGTSAAVPMPHPSLAPCRRSPLDDKERPHVAHLLSTLPHLSFQPRFPDRESPTFPWPSRSVPTTPPSISRALDAPGAADAVNSSATPLASSPPDESGRGGPQPRPRPRLGRIGRTPLSRFRRRIRPPLTAPVTPPSSRWGIRACYAFSRAPSSPSPAVAAPRAADSTLPSATASRTRACPTFPAVEPAWAGREAGLFGQCPGLAPGLGRSWGRRPRPLSRPANRPGPIYRPARTVIPANLEN